MNYQQKVLAPGVENADDADLSAEVLGVGRDLQRRGGTGAKQQIAAGEGPNSSEVNAVPHPSPPPAPANLTATGGPRKSPLQRFHSIINGMTPNSDNVLPTRAELPPAACSQCAASFGCHCEGIPRTHTMPSHRAPKCSAEFRSAGLDATAVRCDQQTRRDVSVTKRNAEIPTRNAASVEHSWQLRGLAKRHH